MSVTVYFAKNAWFLQRSVADETAPELEEFDSASMTVTPLPDGWAPGDPVPSLAEHAVQVVGPPRKRRRARRNPLSTKLVTSTFATKEKEDMLFAISALLETLEPEAGGGFGVGYIQIGGGGASLGNCKESISISRLDEGFVLNHQHPFDKSKITKLHDVDGDEWKGSGERKIPAVAEAILELFPSPSRTGRKEVYGFKAAGEVVDYVRSACVKKD